MEEKDDSQKNKINQPHRYESQIKTTIFCIVWYDLSHNAGDQVQGTKALYMLASFSATGFTPQPHDVWGA